MILPFEPYNPIWKANFDSIQHELLALLKPIRSRVDHIGSTAVEGLSAKPIIDISEEVLDFGDHGLNGLALDPDFLKNGYQMDFKLKTEMYASLEHRVCECQNSV